MSDASDGRARITQVAIAQEYANKLAVPWMVREGSAVARAHLAGQLAAEAAAQQRIAEYEQASDEDRAAREAMEARLSHVSREVLDLSASEVISESRAAEVLGCTIQEARSFARGDMPIEDAIALADRQCVEETWALRALVSEVERVRGESDMRAQRIAELEARVRELEGAKEPKPKIPDVVVVAWGRTGLYGRDCYVGYRHGWRDAESHHGVEHASDTTDDAIIIAARKPPASVTIEAAADVDHDRPGQE